MFKKITMILFGILITLSFFTACTDDSDPTVDNNPPDATIIFTAEESIDATAAKIYEVDVATATRMKIYWAEAGSTDNDGQTADVQVSVYKMDETTPYKIISNNKDFVAKDNSDVDDPKEIFVDETETKIKIKVELSGDNPVAGTFKLIVQKNPVIYSTNDSLLTSDAFFDKTVLVKNAEKVKVYWQEVTTTEEGNDKTANVQGSVYQMDWTTPYKQIDNGKDFEDKDNSSWDNPKEILLDKGENYINIKIEICSDFPDATGTFALFVVDTNEDE